MIPFMKLVNCVIGNFTKVTVYEIGSDVLFGVVVNLFWVDKNVQLLQTITNNYPP